MNDTPGPLDGAVASAEQRLVQLNEQVEAMRAVLVRLLQDVVLAEARSGTSSNARLVEVNQHLVVAALLSQSDAETAAFALDEVSRLARLDALTQLPNRALLLDRFAQAIAGAKRHGHRLALLFLDVDDFKRVNDTLGHAVGDEAIKLVASRLQSAVRAVDTVSRHSGDEFLILLGEVSEPLHAARIAEKLIAAVGEPSPLGDGTLRLTASVGISIYPDDGPDAITLIEQADTAMYASKRRGPGGFAFHGEKAAGERPPDPPPTPSAPPPPGTEMPQPSAPDSRHAQLREANEKLVLAALGAQALRAAAEQAQRRQAEFVAAVANELRNPHAPIRIATAMLGRERKDEPLLPRVQALVEQQLMQMSRLVGDLLDTSRGGAGALELERSVVDMAGVIGQAITACRPAMAARHQQFEAHLPSCALEVNGDPARLEQIVSNLLDNASKHTPDGGQIGLSVDAAGDDLSMTMTVSDSGMGISPQTLPHVFEPFVQDTQAIGLSGVGLGIGLTVVRALVQAHGGTITAGSAGSGRGSQFVVTLPLVSS